MQALWNRISSSASSSMLSIKAASKTTPMRAFSVPCDALKATEYIIVNSSSILATRESIANAFLHVDREDCLARTLHTRDIVIWYSKKAQLLKDPQQENKRASLIGKQPFYGDVVVTGTLSNFMYQACPTQVETFMKLEEPPVKVEPIGEVIEDPEQQELPVKKVKRKKKDKKKRKSKRKRNRHY